MQVNGAPVNFGFQGPNGITISGLSGQLELQTADVTAEAEVDKVRNAAGDDMSHTWYGQCKHATLEFVITGTALGVAITNSNLNAFLPGSFITVTRCDSMPELVGSTWEVQNGAKLMGSNTAAKKLSCPLWYNGLVTGHAT
jgi:hypothetical protein